ncbi:MAG: hypothetical protein ACFHHU_13770 [Porticoccaceae bacterium]
MGRSTGWSGNKDVIDLQGFLGGGIHEQWRKPRVRVGKFVQDARGQPDAQPEHSALGLRCTQISTGDIPGSSLGTST